MQTYDLSGKHIKDFVIQERIGRGGMAEVYRAYQPSVNRDVAVKIIRINEAFEDEAFVRRFAHEAEVIAKLEHIHILPIYAYGVEGNLAYLVMRLLRGGSLSDLLHNGPLPLERAAELFNQFAQGLAYAHSKGVIHRDLKPSNIMLDDAGNAYLTDFGLAKLVSGDLELTKTGNIVGTPAYMSPEQLRGERLDQRSDVYSLGVILYHMLTGEAPFQTSDTDLVSIIYKHLEKQPLPPSKVNQNIPPTVEAVVLKALSKKAEDRFQTVDEMSRALKAAMGLSSSTESAVKPAVVVTPLSQTKVEQPAKRKWWLVGAAGLVVVSLAIVLLLLVLPKATVLPKPMVLAGEQARAEDIIPKAESLRVAQGHFANSGFVAFIACNQTSEYHTAQGREMGDFFAEVEIPYRIYDSNNDKGTQITQIEKARADGAKGLIVCMLDPGVLDSTLKSVEQAGMPLVLFNPGEVHYGGVTIEGDNYLMGLEPGREAGRFIRDVMGGEADVIILDYPDLPIIVQRADGLEDGVKEFAPEVNIIGRYTGGIRDVGKVSVKALLDEGITFDVILSINDAGSFGAVDALAEAGISASEVSIFSVDAEALAREYIQDGYYMRGSLDVDRTGFSQAGVNVMVDLLGGQAVAETVLVPPGEWVTAESES
jgi:ABC-type sugar transport system substrate-binding protein/tRNA A-37 threonylcarbamoyl transferase component Bud32